MNQTVESKDKALDVDAFDTLFNKRDYAAAQRYWWPEDIQHSAHSGADREGLFDRIKSLPPTLTDHTGKRRKLSDLQGQDPMILVLSRGGYCPKDQRQAEGLVQLHREMEVGYSRLVTISTDNMLTTNEYRTGVGAHWTFLSDPGRKVQKDLDIAEYTDPEHNPMIPHVIVLEPGLVIFKIYIGYWFFGRPTIV